jgi:excisionase family DNA binding protein
MTELLKPSQAAERLNVSYGTLAAWRCNRRYPLNYVRIGRKIYYRQEDIDAYIAASVVPGNGPRTITKKRAAR